MYQLTLAIPTYNRATSLRRLLECLESQPSVDRVQILISDNGSDDDTRQTALKYANRLNITLVGFESNRGFDANYLNCIQAATGEYIWVMGDDDLLTPGAVNNVLETIDLAKPDLIVCNGGDYRSGALIPRIGYVVGSLDTADRIMRQLGWHLCWIGTSVLRRDLIDTRLLRKADFNAFIHLPILIRSLPKTISSVYLPSVSIHTTINNSDYFRKPDVLIRTFGKQLFETLACLGSDSNARALKRGIVHEFNKRLSMFNLRFFLRLRTQGQLPIRMFIANIKYLYRLNAWFPTFILFYIFPQHVLAVASKMAKGRSAL